MNIALSLLALALFGIFAGFARSQEAAPPDGVPPRPAPEMEFLKPFAGAWEAEVEMMGQAWKGTETCVLDVGGFWLVVDFEGTFMGAPYRGHGLYGFDGAKQKITGVWVDSMGGPMTLIEGPFSKDRKTFTGLANGVHMSGKPARYKHVHEIRSPKERTFRLLQVQEDGKEELQMKITYRKRA